MALNTNKELKRYYSIKEVAAQFNVAESVLRYWEKEFPNIKPKKSSRNIRQYTTDDISEIRVVYNLLKVRGMKIEAARQVIAKNRTAANDTAEILERLQSLRDELMEISRELKELQ